MSDADKPNMGENHKPCDKCGRWYYESECPCQTQVEHFRSVDLDKLAERIEGIYINKLCQLPVGTPWEKARSEVATILAPILAHNAAMEAVLRECREHIQYIDIGYLQPIITDLLSNIDKLTAKGAGQ